VVVVSLRLDAIRLIDCFVVVDPKEEEEMKNNFLAGKPFNGQIRRKFAEDFAQKLRKSARTLLRLCLCLFLHITDSFIITVLARSLDY